MRAFDRDLIRGGHYGQRSCEPHPKAEHMAAPTNAANVKKALANWEPSTHGTLRRQRKALCMDSKWVGMGVGLGLILGVLVGVVTDQLALWIPIGFALGLAAGTSQA